MNVSIIAIRVGKLLYYVDHVTRHGGTDSITT